MVAKCNCVLGGFTESEFEGKKYHKVQLLGGGEQVIASLNLDLKDRLVKQPLYSEIVCELQLKTYGAKTTAQLISAFPAKQ